MSAFPLAWKRTRPFPGHVGFVPAVVACRSRADTRVKAADYQCFSHKRELARIGRSVVTLESAAENARDCLAGPIARTHAVVDCAQGRDRGYFGRVVAEHGTRCPHEWGDALIVIADAADLATAQWREFALRSCAPEFGRGPIA